MTHALFVHTDVIAPEDGWTPVEPLCALGPTRSFVSGDPASERIRIAYFRRGADGALVAKVWFGPDAEGLLGTRMVARSRRCWMTRWVRRRGRRAVAW